MKKAYEIFVEYWPIIAPAIYELIIRLKPTSRNLSLIDLVYKIISKSLPNYSTTNTTVLKSDSLPSTVTTHVVKIVVLILLSIPAFSQTNGNFKSVRYTPSIDTTTFTPSPTGTLARIGNNLYYHNAVGWKLVSIGNTGNVTGSFTSGQVPYAVGSQALTSSSNLLFTNSSSTLQIGSSNAFVMAPGIGSNFNMTMIGAGALSIAGTTATTGGDVSFSGGTGTTRGGTANIIGGFATLEANYGLINLQSNTNTLGLFSHGTIKTASLFSQSGNNSNNEGMNLAIAGGAGYSISGNGNGGAITINGGLPRGSGTIGNISMETVNGFVGIGQGTPIYKTHITGTANNQKLLLVEEDTGTDIIEINETAGKTNMTVNTTGTYSEKFTSTLGGSASIVYNPSGDGTLTLSGNDSSFSIFPTISIDFSSGNINLSNGVSAITINPTGMVLNVSGAELVFTGLPSTCAGHPSGTIKNVAGVLNICP